MNWYKFATRGRYKGQLQGDEYRPGDAGLMDRLDENELVEGNLVEILKRMVEEKNWNGITSFTQKLKNEGHRDDRIQSMLTRAMYGLRL